MALKKSQDEEAFIYYIYIYREREREREHIYIYTSSGTKTEVAQSLVYSSPKIWSTHMQDKHNQKPACKFIYIYIYIRITWSRENENSFFVIYLHKGSCKKRPHHFEPASSICRLYEKKN